MGKIDISKAPLVTGTRYPVQFAPPCKNRSSRRLGDAAGLTQFGVNLLTLQPGAWSSQRHWHAEEDEFVYVIQGEPTLVTNAGAEKLQPGDCAGFMANSRDGHHLKNETDREVVLLVVGSRRETDHGEYPDIDLKFTREKGGGTVFRHKDGTPY